MKCSAFAIVLSMTVVIPLVNASAEDSPTVNLSQKNANTQGSVKDTKGAFSRLVQAVLNIGEQTEFPNGFAQAIGLSEPMPVKRCHVKLSDDGKVLEERHVFVVYSNKESAGPVCMYLMKGHVSKHERKQEFFRVSLDGQLEKVVMLQNKRGDNGESLAEGRARFEEDLDDSAVRKTFQTEMNYWLKVWLKNQRKAKVATAKLTESAVRDHAKAAHQAVDQEASGAASASASKVP